MVVACQHVVTSEWRFLKRALEKNALSYFLVKTNEHVNECRSLLRLTSRAEMMFLELEKRRRAPTKQRGRAGNDLYLQVNSHCCQNLFTAPPHSLWAVCVRDFWPPTTASVTRGVPTHCHSTWPLEYLCSLQSMSGREDIIWSPMINELSKSRSVLV